MVRFALIEFDNVGFRLVFAGGRVRLLPRGAGLAIDLTRVVSVANDYRAGVFSWFPDVRAR